VLLSAKHLARFLGRMRGTVAIVCLTALAHGFNAQAKPLGGLDVSYSLHKIELTQNTGSKANLVSTSKIMLKPAFGLTLGSERLTDLKFYTRMDRVVYDPGQSGGLSSAVQFGAGFSLSRAFRRFTLGFGADYGTKCLYRIESGGLIGRSTLYQPSGFGELSYRLIATTSKALRLGGSVTRFFPSSGPSASDRFTTGTGFSLYSAIELGKKFQVSFVTGYSGEIMTSTVGTQGSYQIDVGFRFSFGVVNLLSLDY